MQNLMTRHMCVVVRTTSACDMHTACAATSIYLQVRLHIHSGGVLCVPCGVRLVLPHRPDLVWARDPVASLHTHLPQLLLSWKRLTQWLPHNRSVQDCLHWPSLQLALPPAGVVHTWPQDPTHMRVSHAAGGLRHRSRVGGVWQALPLVGGRAADAHMQIYMYYKQCLQVTDPAPTPWPWCTGRPEMSGWYGRCDGASCLTVHHLK